MSRQLEGLIRWSPRVLGLALAGVAALFALDAFNGRAVLAALPEFAMHLLPALLVGGAVVAGWKFPWAGALGALALAAGYATIAPDRTDWIVAVSGPLLVLALLFACDGITRRRPRTA